MKLSEYFNTYLREEFEPYLGDGISHITYKNLLSFQELIKQHDTDIESFDKEYVLSFWNFLKEKGHSLSSTIPKRMSLLKAYGNYLVREGVIGSGNPCERVRKSLFTEKYDINRGLDKKQVRKLIKAELKGAQKRERDLFLFRMYTGLSWQDTKKFNTSWIKNMNGYKMIIGKRGKTGIEFRIPVTPDIQFLLDKLIQKDGTLPITTVANQNKILQDIGKALALPKLHTHLSRHTSGTYYKSKGVPLEIIATVMGHGSIVTTHKRYGQHDDESITKALKVEKL